MIGIPGPIPNPARKCPRQSIEQNIRVSLQIFKKIISFSIQSVIILAVFMHSCDIDQYSMALFINQIKMFLNVSLKD